MLVSGMKLHPINNAFKKAALALQQNILLLIKGYIIVENRCNKDSVKGKKS